MSIRCPVCKAAGNIDATCRRCKADLALVFADRERRALDACAALIRGDFATAWRLYRGVREA